jgi:L-iditol 2-dehydrogenase
MKALINGDISAIIQDVPKPKPTANGEVLIRVAFAALCRTDLLAAEKKIGAAKQVILGHEFSGVISDIGGVSEHLRKGDRVTVHPEIPCGRCYGCQQNDPSTCSNPEFLGINRDGAFAEYIVVPESSVYQLPPSVSLKSGIYLEPVAASLAVLNAGIQPKQSGIILGDDRIAWLTHRILIAKGFQNIQVYALSRETTMLKSDSYDFVIETLMTQDLFTEMVRLVRPRGKIILKSRQTSGVEFMLAPLLRKESVIHPVHYGSFKEAIELLSSGQLAIDDLLGDSYPLEDFQGAFATTQRDSSRKVFFDMGTS